MAAPTVDALRRKTDAAFARIAAQLDGMDPHLDRADAPGEWTTREVLSHLLGQPGWDPTATLKQFSTRDLDTLDIQPGATYLDDARRRMSLAELRGALDAQRRTVLGYLDSLPEADLAERKIRIPLFKQFMGTDEISIAAFVGAMFDFHWNDHAGQLGKIRTAAGLPEAR
jgi:hypothetical protein